jgi:hypothetical protein
MSEAGHTEHLRKKNENKTESEFIIKQINDNAPNGIYQNKG